MVFATRSGLYFYLNYMNPITCPYAYPHKVSLLLISHSTAASIVTRKVLQALNVV